MPPPQKPGDWDNRRITRFWIDSLDNGICQVWLFWVAPIIGAIAAGLFYNAIFESSTEKQVKSELSGNL